MPIKLNPLPPVEICNMALDYNPETGVFTRKLMPAHMYKSEKAMRLIASRDVGKPAGSVLNTGYVFIMVLGKCYVAHRLAWHMAVGPIPEGMTIDHINGDKADNRLCNLRLATHSQNNSNSPRNNKKSGMPRGVTYKPATGRYQAKIKVDSKEIHLGMFPNKLLAYDAYVAAAIKYHGEFAKF